MLRGRRAVRILQNPLRSGGVLRDIRPDGIDIRPVIGKLGINGFRRGPGHEQVGIAVHGENPFPDHHVKCIFLIKQKQPVPVEIPKIAGELSQTGKPSVRIDHIRKFVVRIGIIKMIIRHPAGLKQPLQPLPREGTHAASLRIILDSRKELRQMILLASRPVLHPHLVLNGDDQISARLHMLQVDFQKILKGRFRRDIALPVFKHPDQEHIIIVTGKIRLDIREIPHMNRHVVPLPVSDGVDGAALLRQIHTGDASRLFGKNARHSPHAASHLQHLRTFVHGKPGDDVLPLR